MIKLRPLTAFTAAVFALPILFASADSFSQGAIQPSAVVELFTSQGCSSCPPADRLLGELIQDKEILGLSYSITYWDYIGWKDTFGSKDNDLRQAHYKQEFGSRYVYTPQMVVGGEDHKVGSDRAGVKSLIAETAGHAKSLPLTWNFKDDKLAVELPEGEGGATVWLVDLDHVKEVAVGRGENSGENLVYHNVVRKIRSVGDWDGSAQIIVLDLAELRDNGHDGCALLVQKSGYGPIIAALNINL